MANQQRQQQQQQQQLGAMDITDSRNQTMQYDKPKRKRSFTNQNEYSNSGVPTRNKFAALSPDVSGDEDEKVENREQNTGRGTTVKKVPTGGKMPPIVVTSDINDHATFIERIVSLAQDKSITTRYTKSGFKIFVNNRNSYIQVLEGLKTVPNLTFYTNTLKDEKPKHIVAKGLPILKSEMIIQSLADHDLKCERCIVLKTKEQKDTSPPIYMLTFSKDTNLNEVRKVNAVYNVKVKWERYKNSRKVTQCHKCQGFNHGSSSCYNKPRCLHCDQQHLTKDCQNDKENTKPKCANCLGEHRANSIDCPKYIERLDLIKHLREKRNQSRIPPPQPPPIRSLDHYPHLRVKNNNANTVPPSNSSILEDEESESSKLQDVQELLNTANKIHKICNVRKLLTKMKRLLETLESCKGDESKQLEAFLICADDG